MACNLAFKWRFQDAQATDFVDIIQGAPFAIKLQGPTETLYCTADTFLTSAPDVFFCRVFSDADRTQEITAGDYTGRTYTLDYFDGWTWTSADLYGQVDPQRVGTWRTAEVVLCAEGGVWTGSWVASPKEDSTVQYVFDGVFTRYPLSVTGLSATPTTGTLAAGDYVYNVSAIDSSGKEGAASLPAIVSLSSPGGVDLSWATTTGAVEYHIYRNGEFLTKVTAPTTNFTDDGTLVPQPTPAPRQVPEAGIEDPDLSYTDGGTTITIPASGWTFSTSAETKTTQAKAEGTDQSGNAYLYEITETPNVQVDVASLPQPEAEMGGWDGLTPLIKVTEQRVTFDAGTGTWTVVTTEPDSSVGTVTVDADEVCQVVPGDTDTLIEDLYTIDGGATWSDVLNLDGIDGGYPTVGGLTPTTLGSQLPFPIDVTLELVDPQNFTDIPTEVLLFDSPDVGVSDLSFPSKPGPETVQLNGHATDIRVFQNFSFYVTGVRVVFQTGQSLTGELCSPKPSGFEDPTRTGICRIRETLSNGIWNETIGTWDAQQQVEVECLDNALTLPSLTTLRKALLNGGAPSSILTTQPPPKLPLPKVVYPDPYIGPGGRGTTSPPYRPTDSRGQPSENTYLGQSVAGTPTGLWRPASSVLEGSLRIPASLQQSSIDSNTQISA